MINTIIEQQKNRIIHSNCREKRIKRLIEKGIIIGVSN